ncbi:MAG: hypothetical protein ABI434_15115 [Burkholderiaceae bacterium]
MSKQLRELQSRKSNLVKEARSLTDRIAADGRDMTDDEVTALTRCARESMPRPLR